MHKRNLGMSMLASLWCGHVDNLACFALQNNEAVFTKGWALHRDRIWCTWCGAFKFSSVGHGSFLSSQQHNVSQQQQRLVIIKHTINRKTQYRDKYIYINVTTESLEIYLFIYLFLILDFYWLISERNNLTLQIQYTWWIKKSARKSEKHKHL